MFAGMTVAIIVAAGKGTRMGPNIDKLFLDVAGRPVIAHTWQRFEDCDAVSEVVLVVRDGMQQAFKELQETYKFRKRVTFVAGGKERQDSVWNGLCVLPDRTEIVAIQDGARPCTSAKLISDTIQAAREAGAAVAAQPVVDTIKESENGSTIARHLDRSKLWSVQTPQTFRVEIIRRALGEIREKGLLVTDDTAACELIGQPVRLVVSTDPNPKVTVPADLAYIATILNR